MNTHTKEYVEWMASVWKSNMERQTEQPSHLNKYGYPKRTTPCAECGELECDPHGVGHYNG